MFGLSPPDIFNNIVAYYVIVFFEAVVVVMLARWFRKFHDLTPPTLAFIGIAAFGLMTLGINQVVNLYEWWTRPAAIKVITTTTPNDELTGTIQKWLDNFHLRYQIGSGELGDRELTDFAFIVQSDDEARIVIARLSKEHQQFITLLSRILLEPVSLAKMKSLPLLTQQWIQDQASIELLRQNIVVTGNVLTGIQLEARIPIAELTEAKLMDQLDRMYSALTLCRLKLRGAS